VRLRTGIVLDRSGGALKKQLPLFRLGLGGTLGSGAQWMSLISHHDLIRAIVFLLSADVTGPVNLVGPAPVTNRTFTSTLARALHRPAVIPAPSLALRVVLGTEMANELLLSSQRVEPRVLTAAGFDFDDVTVTDIVARALH
jgi:uncharacterized protein (TIGR01777 family)